MACGNGDGDDDDSTVALFDLEGALDTPATFFDFPYPSDLRLTADGAPNLTGFPNPKGIALLEDLLTVARDRVGYPVMPIAYVQFTGPLAPRVQTDVIPADPSSPILLVDLEQQSLIPVVARTLTIDDYLRNPTLGVAPVPGFVLRGDRSYAYVVMRSLGDEAGDPLGVPAALEALASGDTPTGPRGNAARALYDPLWSALGELGIASSDVAAATVFTTGDAVADLAELSDALLAEYSVTIDDLAVDPDDGADHDRYCELHGTVSYPQFQRGEPPFDDEGLFEIGTDRLPIVQRQETAKVVITIPNEQMPDAGYPLMIYFHGSGGIAETLVDRGRRPTAADLPAKGEGPGYVVAEHGIAGAASSLPLSPDRLPGAGSYEYLNFSNLAAFRDTFRQGVIEQRLLIEALRTLAIEPATLAGCTGPSLPAGATAYSFDPAQLVASGQSMGGMYTNLVTPVEPRIRAAVPTGAGGFWGYFILQTELIPGTLELLAVIIGTPFDELTFMHPVLAILETGWESAEPFAFMPRLARRPLPGHPVRPIYQPVGLDDVYFSTPIYDAAAIAYGHQQAGDEVWNTMQPVLALAGLDGILDYDIVDNLTSETGVPYTGVAVQYADDGIDDAHYIYAQLDDVKYQYGCFFRSFLATGAGKVPDPAPLGTPCP